MTAYHISLKDYPPDLQPRERLQSLGAEALSDGELLALLLSTGTEKLTALDLARQILQLVPGKNLVGLAQLRLQKLCQIKGLGLAKAARLQASFELGRRLNLQRLSEKPSLGRPDLVAAYLRPRFGDAPQEHFISLFLDTKNQVIGHTVNTVGTLNSTLVHPREIFYEAIGYHAHALIVAHNHPSGDPNPSQDDVSTTRRLIACGRLMQIEVLDHVIIGRSGYYSMRENLTLWSEHVSHE